MAGKQRDLSVLLGVQYLNEETGSAVSGDVVLYTAAYKKRLPIEVTKGSQVGNYFWDFQISE